MKKKYFVVSDVHSFFDELHEALIQAGYDKDDKSHIIIFNGDIFDRGPKSLEMYQFIKSIPKSKRIMIKGNHETMLLDAVKKNFPSEYDVTNGTVKTLVNLAGMPYSTVQDIYFSLYMDLDIVKTMWHNIVNNATVKKVVSWLKTKEWLEFYELDNFIFTHAFIPLRDKQGQRFGDYISTITR